MYTETVSQKQENKTKQNTTNPVVLPPKLEHVKRTEVCDISL